MQTHVPWSKVAILGMVIPPLIGNPYNWYIKPYYWVDEFIPYHMEISWELIDPIAHTKTNMPKVNVKWLPGPVDNFFCLRKFTAEVLNALKTFIVAGS